MMLFLLVIQCLKLMFESMKKIFDFVTIQMKAAEQIFPVVLVIMLYLQGGSNF